MVSKLVRYLLRKRIRKNLYVLNNNTRRGVAYRKAKNMRTAVWHLTIQSDLG